MPFEIKDEFLDTVVGFNDSAEPLGKRNDLHLLAEMALKSDGTVKDKHIIGMFKTVPTLDEIRTAKESGFSQKQSTKQSNIVVNQNSETAK